MSRLLGRLGHEDAAVVGHDRGSYVAFRMAMDTPHVVYRLAVLDSVPIGEALARCNARFAMEWWHWFFFAQPEVSERVILADPDAWYAAASIRWARRPTRSSTGPSTTPRRSAPWWMTTGPASGSTARTTTPIRQRDAGSPAPRSCCGPAATTWRSSTEILTVWRTWANDLSGGVIDSGHHMAEEAPEQLAEALRSFLRPLADA